MTKKTQKQRFIEKAKELECDETENSFDNALKKVVKMPQPKDDNEAKNDGD